MRIYLDTLGCRLNEAESAAWARALGARGGRIVATPQLADVMVLNTCAVTAEAARKSRKRSGRLHRSNPRAKLVLTGCLAALQPDEAAALAGVDLVLSNRDKDNLVELLDRYLLRCGASGEPAPLESTVAAGNTTRTRAFVKVQDGCRNRCTFCIVTVARGEERSRPIDEVVQEVNDLHRAGWQEVVLTGVHLGGYGFEWGEDLAALVAQLLRHTSIPRIRLSSLEPWEIPPGLWDLWGDRRLCPHLHLPLQSGSDLLLRRMARRCDAGSYLDLVARARAAIADLIVTTDIIVGFPGELEEHFEQTLRVCQQVGFAHVHIFPYSPREGTAAARMGGQVAHAIKRERSRRLHALARRMRDEQLDRVVGSERAVLWEGSGDPFPGGQKRWTGLTDNYLRVAAVVSQELDLSNTITPTRLTAPTADGLLGAEIAGEGG